MPLTFSWLEGRYGIYRCGLEGDFPLMAERFLSYTRTEDELSIICREGMLDVYDRKQEGYEVIKLHGPFDLATTGVLAEVARLFTCESIPIFVISTFDTDYILIRTHDRESATQALVRGGHRLAD